MARKRKIEVEYNARADKWVVKVSGRKVYDTIRLFSAIAFVQGYTKRDDISENDRLLRWYF